MLYSQDAIIKTKKKKISSFRPKKRNLFFEIFHNFLRKVLDFEMTGSDLIWLSNESFGSDKTRLKNKNFY